jgi:flagellar biosynthesis protein FliR
MINLDLHQLGGLLAQLFWPFMRIGACLMIAPAFGAATVPARVRIVLAGSITLLVAPLLPPPPAVEAFSGTGLLITAQQLLIGGALGFCLQILFDAVTLGGQVLANGMGLSLAYNIDPLHGGDSSSPALGQLYTLLVMLCFLALNGHLAVIETLVQSFQAMPIGGNGLGTAGIHTVVEWGSVLFEGALAIALPGVTALLIVHLAFGVMSRAAPAFNLFAIGLPVSLVCGLVIAVLGVSSVQTTFEQLLTRSFAELRLLLGIAG